VKAGGFIENNRVNGALAMTRVLGDARYKDYDLPPENHIVTAIPELVSYPVVSDDGFLVLASDGIWDCFGSQEAIDIIRYHISLGATLTQACVFMCDVCVAPSRSYPFGTDNTTIIIVVFLHGQTEAEWMDWIAARVQAQVGRATPSTIPQLYMDKQLQHPAHIFPDFDSALPIPEIPQRVPSPYIMRIIYV